MQACSLLGGACCVLLASSIQNATQARTRALPPLPCADVDSASAPTTSAEFLHVLDEVAEGWNRNDARRAASCFTQDAVYGAAGSPGVRHGRRALYEFFGGAGGRPDRMLMAWHHRAFNPGSHIGFAEYTFRYRNYQAHGIVVVRMRGRKIANWKEYEFASEQTWEDFSGANRF